MLLTQEEIDQFKEIILKGYIDVRTIDLESSPVQFWGWQTGEQYVDYKQLINMSETKLITAQYMTSLSDRPKYFMWDEGDDTRVVKGITQVINDADIVIGQNIRAFDLKLLQNRCRQLRLPPVNVDFNFDTTTHSRSSFRQMSHSLDYRSKQYGMSGKIKMEMQDWIDIVQGKTSPKVKMIPYGLKDIIDGDKLFWLDLPYYNLPKTTILKIRRLIAQHLFVNKCTHCERNKEAKFDYRCINKSLNKFQCNRCEDTWMVKK